MEIFLLTKSTAPIIGWVAELLGLMMDGIFRVTSAIGFANIGLCIIIFTIIINLFLYPLTIQQQKSSKLMNVMQPEIQAIQKKYKGKTDNESMMRMQAETKAVYAKYGTSMTGGCVLLAIQMPILFALYQVIYKIPAYVPAVKAVFSNIATPLMQDPDFISKITSLAAAQHLPVEKYDYTVLNKVIDLFYKFTPANWETLSSQFPSFAGLISQNAAKINEMNSFLGVNLSTPPLQGWMPNWAWLIPILAGLTQWYSAKLMTVTTSSSADDNPMAAQMKSMNTVMPLMSVFFCFTLASGLGVYWVASAVCRIIQQFIINRKLNKMDVDEIVRQNIEKANQQRIKKGLKPQQPQEINKMLRNVKSMETKTDSGEDTKAEKLSSIAKQVKDSTSYYNQNAKPGSLAAKANMVAMYDNRMNEKKRGKKSDSKNVSADAADSSAPSPVPETDGGKDTAAQSDTKSGREE